MKQFQLIFLFLLIALTQAQAQSQVDRSRISGVVTDARTGEPVKQVSFEVLPYKREVKADKEGKFILNLPKGSNITLVFDYYPFDKQEIHVTTQNDTTLMISLTSPFTNRYLEEVEIIAGKPVNDKPASIERLDKQLFLTLPALMGERDVVKALSITAGVSSSSEASADMQVRGGTHGQNLYLMNDIPLYFTQHALGLTSAYNPSILQNAVFYKAAFPARYGGKVSSILAVNTIEPSLTKRGGEFELGIISSKAMLNLPLKKEKLGVYLSGRISNFTPLLGLLTTFTAQNDTRIGISFADLNAGIKYKVSDKDDLNLDFFRVADNWNIRQKDFNDLTSLYKNNSQLNLSLNWKRKINENTENKLLIYADRFVSGQKNSVESEIKNQPTQYTEYGFHSAITTLNISEYFSKKFNETLQMTLGGSLQDNIIFPLRFISSESLEQKPSTSSKMHFYEGSIFSEVNLKLSDKQSLDLGARVSLFGRDDVFWSIEPRASYLLQLPDNYSFSTSFSRMSQPIHRVANSGLGLPMEIYVPSFNLLEPETSWTSSIGIGKEIYKANYRMTMKADVWYKYLANIVEFRDGMDAFSMLTKGYNVYDTNQQIVATGQGNAYGLDVSVSYTHKKMSLIADYTLMRAVNQFKELNDGMPFAASTDIRNSLALTWSYKFKHNLLFTANWLFNSGRPITVPTHVLPKPEINLTDNNLNLSNEYSSYLFLYTERNNYRTRAFHKLDISLTKNFLLKRKYQSSFSVGLYNTYNQANPFVYNLSVKKKSDGTYYPALNSISVFPILPSFSWRIKF